MEGSALACLIDPLLANAVQVERNTKNIVYSRVSHFISFSAPDPNAEEARIPESELPWCLKCSGLLRPNVVWFGEGLDPQVIQRAGK